MKPNQPIEKQPDKNKTKAEQTPKDLTLRDDEKLLSKEVLKGREKRQELNQLIEDIQKHRQIFGDVPLPNGNRKLIYEQVMLDPFNRDKVKEIRIWTLEISTDRKNILKEELWVNGELKSYFDKRSDDEFLDEFFKNGRQKYN